MTNFTPTEVKRAIRDFDSTLHDLMNTDSRTYKARIKSFMNMIKTNPVIYSIVNPILELDVNLDEIHNSRNGYWISSVDLPEDKSEQIAYILKVFRLQYEGELSLENLAHLIYVNKNISYNIEKYLREIATPILRELLFRIQDLVEDKVEGEKEEISSSKLQIINHGTITAQQGNIALGQNIQQHLTNYSIAEDIMKQVREEQTVNETDLPEVQSLAQEVEAEIVLAEPSRSKLKDIAGKVFAIGQQGLLRTFTNVVNNPAWAQAVTDYLLGQ